MNTQPSDTGAELLRDASRVVLKFGGDNAGAFLGNMELVKAMLREGKKLALVFSAIRSSHSSAAQFSLFDPKKDAKNASQFNTTSHLIEMAKAAQVGDFNEANRWLNAVEEFTIFTVNQNLTGAVESDFSPEQGDLLQALQSVIREECEKMRGFLREACEVPEKEKAGRFFGQGVNGEAVDRMFDSKGAQPSYVSFTGFGEDLAEKIYHTYFQKSDITSSALEAGTISDAIFGENPREAIERQNTIVDRVRKSVATKIEWCFKDTKVLISGGRLPGAAGSRGYSDVAAVVLAQAMEVNGETPLIWIAKQSPIKSRDPNLSPDAGEAQFVECMSLPLAYELFASNGAGAAALHSDAVNLLRSGMNVVVGNPTERESRLTWISHDHKFDANGGYPPRVQVVAVTEVPQIIKVTSGDMVERPGVMGEILRTYRDIVVGHTHTDAFTITITLHSKADQSLAEELETLLQNFFDPNYRVEVIEGQAWVFCLGNDLGYGDKAQAYWVLAEHGFHSAFQTGSQYSFRVLVPKDKAPSLARALHEEFFEKSDTLQV